MPPRHFAIRNAQPADMPTIRRMVLRERMDPTQLKTENFLVAETVQAGLSAEAQAGQPRIIGCGQVRDYPGARELGSLVVEPDWRGRGVGSTLVRWLLAGLSAKACLRAPHRQAQAGTAGDVHLACPAELASYYRQFGFELIGWTELPAALKLKFGLGRLLSLLPGVSIVSMRKTVTR